MKKFLFAALFACSLASPCYAVQVNLKQNIFDATGQPMQDCDHFTVKDDKPFCDKYVPVTLGRVIAVVLDKADQTLKPSEIIERGTLARQVREAMLVTSTKKGNLDIPSGMIDVIKEGVVKMGLLNSQVTQIFELLSLKAAE